MNFLSKETLPLVIVAVVVLGALGYAGFKWGLNSDNGNTEDFTSEQVAGVVATVNGNEITRQEFNAQMQQLASNPQVQIPSEDQSEERAEFEELVLGQLINDILLVREAERLGFSADQEVVDTQYDGIIGQFETEEAFQAQLEASGLDETALKESIRRQLTVNQYFRDAIVPEATVTDEEVRTFFDEQIAPQDDSLVFEEVQEQVRNQLRQQKAEEILSQKIQELRDAADIQTSL